MRTRLFALLLTLLVSMTSARADTVCSAPADDSLTQKVVLQLHERGSKRLVAGATLVVLGAAASLLLGGLASADRGERGFGWDAIMLGSTAATLGGISVAIGIPVLAKGVEDRRDADRLAHRGLRVAF
jgi:hypothetical protein